MADLENAEFENHPYFLFAQKLYEALVLDTKSDLKKEIPKFFDESVSLSFLPDAC